MSAINLATLPEEDRDKIELHKQICFARFKCKGKNRHEQNQIIASFPQSVQDEIQRLRKKKNA